MNNTASVRTCLPEFSHLTHTISELYKDTTKETLAAGMNAWDPVRERIELKRRGVTFYKDSTMPYKANPFEGTLALLDRSAHRLTILLNLSKPLRVIAEIYATDGTYIKRLFNRPIKRGATEIIGLGCRNSKGDFILVLHSCDGIKSLRIRKSAPVL